MTLIIGFIFGMFGLGYFMYGKRMEEYAFLVFGLVLMGYVYFVPGALMQAVIGIVLLSAPFLIKRFYN